MLALHGVLGEATSEETGTTTADEFATYFREKIDSVRVSTASTPLFDVLTKATPTLAQWTAVTRDEVEQMIRAALNKSCQLDPAPTWVDKDMSRLLSPFITLFFNKSLTSGIFPSHFKHAVVRPLLKKNGLDVSDPKNFWPVSNLSFLSKLLERIVQKRLQAS